MTSVGEQGFPGSSAVKNPPAMQETQIRSLGSPREGNGNPCQYSCLGYPVDRGAWRATVHGVAKSWVQLRDQTTVSEQQRRDSEPVRISRVGRRGPGLPLRESSLSAVVCNRGWVTPGRNQALDRGKTTS